MLRACEEIKSHISWVRSPSSCRQQNPNISPMCGCHEPNRIHVYLRVLQTQAKPSCIAHSSKPRGVLHLSQLLSSYSSVSSAVGASPLGWSGFDSPSSLPTWTSQVLLRGAGSDGSRVRASRPCKAANLNRVHERQQVPCREGRRGDIGAAGGSIYSCFSQTPV